MKEEGTSRKQIIKKVAVIFLVGLLVLTFFSNTIMNYSLPEVATEPVMSGTVSNKVRGQGVVETNSDYEVMVSGTRVIKEVKFEAGDEVKKGDVLFTFEEGENTELEEAQDLLDQLELNYAKSLLKVLPNYESDNLNIQDAKDSLDAAIAAQEQAATNAANLKTAKDEAAAAQSSFDTQQAVVNELQAKVDAYGEVGDYDEAKALADKTESELTTLKGQLEEWQQSYEDALANGEDTFQIEKEIKTVELEITTKESDLERQKAIADALQGISGSYNEALEKLSAESMTLSTLQTTLEAKNARVDELSVFPSVEEAKATVKERENSLKQQLLSLKDRKEQDAINQKIESMDMKVAEEEIAEQREKVEELQNSNDLTEIKSKEDGVIAQIDYKKGDTVMADTPIARIQLSESGYIVKINITKAQSKLIRVGDEANIENIWGEDITASVKSIKADPENPNQSMILTFAVKGEANPGETLVFSVGEKSNRYDAVVPNSAIKEDSKGKFVLVVTVKGSPLGNRYKVKRADVEVLASDDTSSGVAGALYEYDNVVTNSSKPLESGMQVRLVD